MYMYMNVVCAYTCIYTYIGYVCVLSILRKLTPNGSVPLATN